MIDPHEVHWNPGEPPELDERPEYTGPDDLDQAVQALVDHDREDKRRATQREALRYLIVDKVKQRGYRPHIDADPVEFRCGDIVVRVGSEFDVSYRIVTRLYATTEEW